MYQRICSICYINLDNLRRSVDSHDNSAIAFSNLLNLINFHAFQQALHLYLASTLSHAAHLSHEEPPPIVADQDSLRFHVRVFFNVRDCQVCHILDPVVEGASPIG